jgi:hypothetical protein
MQAFELSELHIFVTGKLIASGSAIEIQGYIHQFDDFHKYPDHPDMWTWPHVQNQLTQNKRPLSGAAFFVAQDFPSSSSLSLASLP